MKQLTEAQVRVGYREMQAKFPLATKCADCGKAEGRIVRHHVDGNPTNNAANNLRELCCSCHMKEHANMRGRAGVTHSITLKVEPETKRRIRQAMIAADCANLKELHNLLYAPLTTGTVASRTKAARDLRETTTTER